MIAGREDRPRTGYEGWDDDELLAYARAMEVGPGDADANELYCVRDVDNAWRELEWRAAPIQRILDAGRS